MIQDPAMPMSLARGTGRSEPGNSTWAIMSTSWQEKASPEWHSLLFLTEAVH